MDEMENIFPGRLGEVSGAGHGIPIENSSHAKNGRIRTLPASSLITDNNNSIVT